MSNHVDHSHAHTHHLEEYLNFEDRKDVYMPLIEYIEKDVQTRDRSGLKLLEVGCAAGAFLSYVSEGSLGHRFEEIAGVDPDPEALAHASGNISTERAIADELPFPDGSFDYVVMVSVLHHLVGRNLKECWENWRRSMDEALRVCKPGGVLLIREGLAVRNKLFQRMIFRITSFLSQRNKGVKRLRIDQGEVLAFLAPSDMQSLFDSMNGVDVLHFSRDQRLGGEFSGITKRLWSAQTCSLTGICQRQV